MPSDIIVCSEVVSVLFKVFGFGSTAKTEDFKTSENLILDFLNSIYCVKMSSGIQCCNHPTQISMPRDIIDCDKVLSVLFNSSSKDTWLRPKFLNHPEV